MKIIEFIRTGNRIFTVEDFNTDVFGSIIEFIREFRYPTNNKRGLTKLWPARYASLFESRKVIAEAGLSDIRNQFDLFKDQFMSYDQRNDLRFTIGSSFSALSITASLEKQTIELDGFVNSKKIAHIGLDNNDRIDFIEFENGDQYPSASEFTLINNTNITNTIFFVTTADAYKAFTAIWMLISQLEGSGWSLISRLKENATSGASTSGGFATIPATGAGNKVGSLFGGTYTEPKPKTKTRKQK